MSDKTIVCRCEEVTRATIEAAVAAGAQTLNELKLLTNLNMGGKNYLTIILVGQPRNTRVAQRQKNLRFALEIPAKKRVRERRDA